MYSDSDENNSNEFSYNFSNMSVTAKGPNLATYRNNNFTKAMKMSRDFGRSEGTRYLYDSRGINNRRDSSPKSIRSVCDYQPSGFNFCQYTCGTSSQSVYNFKNRNPGGLPSYVTATEIALSLQYNTFNHLDLKILQKAIRCFQNRFQKNSVDQGSNSSLSNDDDDDDNRSTRSSIFKENMSSYKSTYAYSSSSRISRQKRLYNGSSHNSRQQNHVRNERTLKVDNLPNNFQSRTVNAQPLQKDRFKNRYLLPSQRFNKSTAASVITENFPTIQPTVKNTEPKNNNDTVPNKTSENINEEIFSNVTVENNNKAKLSCKRKLEENTAILSNKRSKLSPIKKISDNNITVTERAEINDKDETEDFCFIKPSFPIRKSCKVQNKNNVISECAQTSDHVAPTSQLESPNSHNVNESVDKSLDQVSNRPSFIKRKLFTQKLDVAENKNISFDNVNSPIHASSQIQKEKNKTRKLVSNLSCLNRDDTQDTNYLELIHKIVPPNQINSTYQRNKMIDNKEEDVNKWDITSIVSECHSKDGSNTYTDEEIFECNSTDDTKQNKSIKKKQSEDCHDVLENSHAINSNSNIISKTTKEQDEEKNLEPKGNNIIKSVIISDRFWDTDMESDVEDQNKQKKFPEIVIKDKVSENKPKTNIRKNTPNYNDVESHIKSQEKQKMIPESKNNDITSDNKTKLQVLTDNFWDIDFDSDLESPQDVQQKILEAPNKDNALEKYQNNEDSTALQFQKSNVNNNNNHNSNTLDSDNVSVCTSTSNNNKLNTRKYKIRSHREPKKIKCCTTDLKNPPNTIFGVKSNSKLKDNCTADNDKVNNKQAEENKENSKRRGESIKKSSQIRTSKQTGELKAMKCLRKTSVSKLNSETKPNTNDMSHSTNRTAGSGGRAKQKTSSKKALESSDYESDLSFSLSDSSVLTRSRTRAIFGKSINDSTPGNTDKSSQRNVESKIVVSKGKISK